MPVKNTRESMTTNCTVCGEEPGVPYLRISPEGKPDGELHLGDRCSDRYLIAATGNRISDGAAEVICKVFGYPTFRDNKGTKYFPVLGRTR